MVDLMCGVVGSGDEESLVQYLWLPSHCYGGPVLHKWTVHKDGTSPLQ